ncbi:MAG: hypothetical protein MI867_06120 [Pseudomonadales bacterium]|nr:hypothetical protein [Pseudomonadales bacterium]
MNSKAVILGTALLGAAALSNTANAGATKYEGLYVMEPGCTSVTLTAGIGYAVIEPNANVGELTFDSVGQGESQSITLSCDDATIDPTEVEAFAEKASATCQGLSIPWQSDAQREEYCDDLALQAVDSVNAIAGYFLSELVYSMDVDILRDYWIGGLGQMDYVFVDGDTEHRGPNVAVWNNGRFYRGFGHEADTPNPLNCPVNERVGKMDANIDLSSAFGGGARMYLSTNIVDGVVCPVINPFEGQLVVAAYGFAINIKQQGDRQ